MKALIAVDIQYDFLPGGALAVPGGDEVIPVVNDLMDDVDLVVATQDWHPADHKSFAANHEGREPGDVIDLGGLEQVLWPVHCVQGTRGAQFAAELRADRFDAVIRKGMDPGTDSYSGFFDNGRRKATGLDGLLTSREVDEVIVAGLATEYCVKFTALDAVDLGYRTTVAVDACRGVELNVGDVEKALDEMRARGIAAAITQELLSK